MSGWTVQPVFADIEPQRLGLDPAAFQRAITTRTSAILAVHVYGVLCDVTGLDEMATRHGLRLICDAAHAFDVKVDGIGIGNFGDLAMFSFPATKHFYSAAPERLPVARQAAEECLALPLYGALALAAVDRICAMLRRIAAQGPRGW